MDKKNISFLVAGITSGLKPSVLTSAEQLETLKLKLTVALQEQDILDIIPAGLSRIDKLNIQKELINTETVSAYESLLNRPGDESYKTALGESPYKVFRREVPVRTSQYEASVPKWAAGQAVDHTIGPFIDNFGKWYWFDFFKVVHHVTVARGSDLFIQVPIRGFLFPQQHYNLVAGSVWIRSQLLTSSAPPGAYTGVKIKGGKISFSSPVTISGDTIIVNGADDCELKLDLDQPLDNPALDTITGDDAKNLTIKLPSTVSVLCKPGSASISAAGDMALGFYGSSYKFTRISSPPVYEPVLNRILVPYKGDKDICSLLAVNSTLFRISGSASIIDRSWALPVTVAHISQLGEADGIGAIAIKVKPGFAATWEGIEKGPVKLNESYLMVEPGRISITAMKASSRNGRQKFELWDEKRTGKKIRSEVDLQYAKQFTLIYNCLSIGSEVTLIRGAALKASIDRPLSADKHRLKINALSADVTLMEQKGICFVFLLARDMMQQFIAAQQTKELLPISFALSNALIKTTPVDDFLLIGKWNASKDIHEGSLILNCPIYFLLPTLPDPYVTNFNPLTSIERRPEAYSRSHASYAAGKQSGFGLSILVQWPDPAVADLKMFFVRDTVATKVFLEIEKQDPKATSLDTDAAGRTEIDFSILAHHKIKIDRTGEVKAEDERNSANLRELFNESLRVSAAEIYLLDVSTNADLMGVGFGTTIRNRDTDVSNVLFPFSVIGMDLSTYAFNSRIYSLPQIQWEPLWTIQNADVKPYPFPSPTTSPDTGDPTIIGTTSFKLVPIAPKPVMETFRSEYNDPLVSQNMALLFSLPFGMKTVALIDNPTETTKQGAMVSYNQPEFIKQNMKGALQLTILATSPDSGTDAESPGFKGAAIQTRNLIELLSGVIPLDDNGNPLSVLGPVVDSIFNFEFKPGGANPRVPLERVDLCGYGATIFSNWLNPTAQIAATSQAKFDVLIGRTAHEVIQVKSILYPWGIAVVRTITIQRTSGGGVTRHDSGWKAQGPGIYDFSYTDASKTKHATPFEFHPGVVKGIYNVTGIRDSSRIYRKDDPDPKESVVMQEVFFNGDLLIEDVKVGAFNGFVPSKNQRGFIQLSPYQKPLTSQQFYELLIKEGSLGGPVDCVTDVGISGQPMRIVRVDVTGVDAAGTKIFVPAGHGSILLPKEGSWSLVMRRENSQDIVTLNQDDALPLIREGKLNTTPTEPYRFAHPIDIKSASTPRSDYGILHSTGSQKVLFLRPTIQRSDKNIRSTHSPYFADSYAMLRTKGIFPPLNSTFPLGAGGTALAIKGEGKLQLTSGGHYKIPAGYTRDLLNNGSSRIYVDYSDVADSGNTSDVDYSFDSLAPVAWQASVKRESIVVDMMGMKKLICMTTAFNAAADKRAQLDDPKMKFGSILQPIVDVISFLGNFDMAQALLVNMGNSTTNSWHYKFKASITGFKVKFPLLKIYAFGRSIKGPSEAVEEAFEHATPLPPLKLEFEMEVEVYDDGLSAIISLDAEENEVAKAKEDMLASGAALIIKGKINILCVAISPTLGLYFVGIVEFEFGLDSAKGKSFGFKVAIGLELATKWPIVGEVAIMMAMGIEMEWSDSGSGMFVIMIFKGEAELLGGMIVIGISIEAKGGNEKEIEDGVEKTFAVCEVEFAAEISIAFFLNFEFDVTWQEKKQIS